jgi:hypothetical protein
MRRKRTIKALLSHDSNVERNLQWNEDFWAGVSDELKFKAAWELVELAWVQKGGHLDELRLKRSIGLFKPASR